MQPTTANMPNPFHIEGWFSLLLLLLATALLVLGLLAFIEDSTSNGWPQPIGCKKIGLSQPRNMLDEYDVKHSGKDASTASKSYVKALYIYPIKSCMPVELQQGTVVSTGMKYDRQFSFAQLVTSRPRDSQETTRQWKFITQRDHPRLTLVKTELWVPDSTNPSYREDRDVIRNGGCIVVSFPYSPAFSFSVRGLKDLFGSLAAKYRERNWSAESTVSFEVPFLPTPERMRSKQYSVKESMTIWKEDPLAFNVSSEIPLAKLDKLRQHLGLANPLALFRVDASSYREVFRCAPRKQDVGYQPEVGFADAYPLSIMGLASVQNVASRLPKTIDGDCGAIRFRSNIYVTGGPPYVEDDWKRVRINGHEYHITSRLTRCKLPNVNPKTGVPDRNEPYTSMSKHRCIDEGAKNKPCLGMHVVPSTADEKEICVGDEVEVLETGPHFYIKQ